MPTAPAQSDSPSDSRSGDETTRKKDKNWLSWLRSKAGKSAAEETT